MNIWFSNFARASASYAGNARAFILAAMLVGIWGGTGPVFHFSDTWQLVMNTVSSIVTFLMVFLIQNAQNRETNAIQLKLDELIRVLDGARDELQGIERRPKVQLLEFKSELAGTHVGLNLCPTCNHGGEPEGLSRLGPSLQSSG